MLALEKLFMQQIGFKDLRISCIIGLYSHEREKEQLLFIDLTIDTKEFIDYSAIALLVTAIAQEGRFFLIETLGHEAVKRIREQWPAAEKGRICLKKPEAIPEAAYAFAEISW